MKNLFLVLVTVFTMPVACSVHAHKVEGYEHYRDHVESYNNITLKPGFQQEVIGQSMILNISMPKGVEKSAQKDVSFGHIIAVQEKPECGKTAQGEKWINAIIWVTEVYAYKGLPEGEKPFHWHIGTSRNVMPLDEGKKYCL